MFNNRLVNIMLIVLIALTLIGAVALVLYTQFFDEGTADGEPTIDEVIERSVETDEITTNLQSNQVIRSQFVIELNDKGARNELEKRDFQVEDIIINELSELGSSDVDGQKGREEMKRSVMNEMNQLLQEGYVEEIYINQWVVQ
ncbi:flagellar basal body-associated protein FliL [Salisediminibacterium halotolerans]|uniref:flagellar basal body-associated protein FliL n=1 Tax=Salisediminibacterium halotolerans TaxID=517425 RepID=UPI000EB38544|nr:flagellar basal body-associated protein FliL [Salisediminibacterium halotolerans]RLJ74212.1 flagellar FliL protein [Actinophytocola xinjiangensis]RPE87695.1 flagellar FliL protein [Salisediminibacterium halotolerans]TWG35049.1 flagellar FliL protein [Salisediminibacterium halotolerans]GEL06664.1 flagellar protein FliL [Salisediminibacterium halotolerans]